MNTNYSAAAKRKTISNISFVALFAALISAGTFISIPLPFSPVPIVLQNFFAILAGLLLGPFLGSLAVGLYLLAGSLGLPVFAGAAGGFAVLLGPAGGFLPGYLLGALSAGLIAGKPRPGKSAGRLRISAAVCLGLAIVYVPGLVWLKHVIRGTWVAAFTAGLAPFIIGDVVKGAAAVLIAPRLRRVIADLL
jgi:biotin transport system substrate-specific component